MSERAYVKSKQAGITVKHINPSFKYKFQDEPIEMKIEHAEFLVKDNPGTFEIVKGYKPSNPSEPLWTNMSKDELLDYTAKKGIEADYSMTKKELIKIIEEANK